MFGQMVTARYNELKSKEDAYNEQRIKGINDAYNLEVSKINAKYDLLSQKAQVQFSADSLAIQTKTNEDLMAFVTNEDSKLWLTSEYQAKRNFVIEQFASQIKPITADMSQVEIDGINAAIKARDEQLAKIEKDRQTEIQNILNAEGQKRKILSETDQIVADGKEALEQLAIKFAASEIERNTKKNLEILAAEVKRNNDLELEAKRHNDELVRLGLEKDELLKASFIRLKDTFNAGYDEMLAKAQELYNKGIITGEQYLELIRLANAFRDTVNSTPNGLVPLSPTFIEPVVTPKFENGGWIPNGSRHSEGGIHLIDDKRGYLGNMEGGEYIGIFSREVTAKYGDLLHKIQNSSLSTTGKPIYAEKGYFGKNPLESPLAQSPLAPGGGTQFLAAQVQLLNLQTSKTNELLDAIMKSNANIANKPVLSTRKIQEELQREYEVNNRGSFG
jgi:hypothetical protein